jgi:hypothetical protein
MNLLGVITTLPVPEDYHAGSTSKWLFTIWAGIFALLTLPYCIYRLTKGDQIAIYAWVGGFITSLGEPMLDHLGHLWWPTNLPGPAFSGYDLQIPFLIPPCYVFFTSMTGYFAYRMFRKGITVRQVFYVWLAIAATDLALEIPGTAAKAYKYYGVEPFAIFHFPMHWAWINGTGMLAIGFMLYFVGTRLHGGWKPLTVLLPVVGFLGAYGIVGWPAFLAINWEMSKFAMHVVDLGSLALCLLLVRGIAAMVATDQPLGQLLRKPEFDEEAASGNGKVRGQPEPKVAAGAA